MGTLSGLEKFTSDVQEAMSHLRKNNPSDVTDWVYGTKDQGHGIFSHYVDDIISDLASGGSALLRWLPARGVNTWNEHIGHLSFVTAEGYDGSTSYMAHLVGQDEVGECDFGDGADYQVYEYSHTMHRMSFSNKSKPFSRTVGMSQHKKMSRKYLRGARAGMNIESERDWVLAMLVERLEGHQSWNAWYGDPAAPAAGNGNMYDGLNNLITNGWVRSKMIGSGAGTWTDPIVVNGVPLDTLKKQVRMIRAVASKIIERMRDRGYTPNSNDMAIAMSGPHWRALSEAIATGALVTLFDSSVDLSVTPEVVQRELMRVRSGGLGAGTIEVSGVQIPILIDNMLGHNTTLSTGEPGVTGDIYVLTRFYRGMTVLEHQYLDWSQIPTQAPDGERNVPVLQQGNMIRTTWGYTDTARTCWWYGMEMWGRITPLMMPLQARINDVTVEAWLDDELESGNYAHPNWYGYEGQESGAGTSLITPLSDVL